MFGRNARTAAPPDNHVEPKSTVDQVVQWLNFRHVVALPMVTAASERTPAKHHAQAVVFTPPRDLLAVPMVRHTEVDHVIGEEEHREARKKALRVTKVACRLLFIVMFIVAILYSIATIIFGRHHELVCLAQNVSNGLIQPGFKNSYAQATCEDGHRINQAVMDVLRCRKVKENCFVAKAATAAEEAKKSCEQMWVYTTESIAVACMKNQTTGDVAASYRAANFLCIPEAVYGVSRLYSERSGVRPVLALQSRQATASRRSIFATTAICFLIFFPFVALVVTTLARAQRLPRDRNLSSALSPCGSDEDDVALADVWSERASLLVR